MEIYGNITNDDLVSGLKYDLTFAVFILTGKKTNIFALGGLKPPRRYE
jgi:hypothetical protein